MSEQKPMTLVKYFYKGVSVFVLTAFLTTSIVPQGFAQSMPRLLNLPAPGTMLNPSVGYVPAMLKAVTVDPKNPFQLDFILDTGESGLKDEALRQEGLKLIKYFLATMTVPEDDLWVNLSPYEKNRIIPNEFGKTEMGRDLLAQDYLLKQLTSSLIFPENEMGKKFWEKMNALMQNSPNPSLNKEGNGEVSPTSMNLSANRQGGVPGGVDVMDLFHKIWIVPDRATVYQHNGTAVVVDSHLRVMLEEDLVAAQNSPNPSLDKEGREVLSSSVKEGSKDFPSLEKRGVRGVDSTDMLKETILPAIENEINTGKNFAQLRQVYNSMILATWYKMNLKQSILAKAYADQNKVKGIDANDPAVNQEIYNQYIETFRTNAHEIIKEDYDPVAQEVVAHKYITGGVAGKVLTQRERTIHDDAVGPDRDLIDFAMQGDSHGEDISLTVELGKATQSASPDAAMVVSLKQGDLSPRSSMEFKFAEKPTGKTALWITRKNGKAFKINSQEVNGFFIQKTANGFVLKGMNGDIYQTIDRGSKDQRSFSLGAMLSLSINFSNNRVTIENTSEVSFEIERNSTPDALEFYGGVVVKGSEMSLAFPEINSALFITRKDGKIKGNKFSGLVLQRTEAQRYVLRSLSNVILEDLKLDDKLPSIREVNIDGLILTIDLVSQLVRFKTNTELKFGVEKYDAAMTVKKGGDNGGDRNRLKAINRERLDVDRDIRRTEADLKEANESTDSGAGMRAYNLRQELRDLENREAQLKVDAFWAKDDEDRARQDSDYAMTVDKAIENVVNDINVTPETRKAIAAYLRDIQNNKGNERSPANPLYLSTKAAIEADPNVVGTTRSADTILTDATARLKGELDKQALVGDKAMLSNIKEIDQEITSIDGLLKALDSKSEGHFELNPSAYPRVRLEILYFDFSGVDEESLAKMKVLLREGLGYLRNQFPPFATPHQEQMKSLFYESKIDRQKDKDKDVVGFVYGYNYTKNELIYRGDVDREEVYDREAMVALLARYLAEKKLMLLNLREKMNASSDSALLTQVTDQQIQDLVAAHPQFKSLVQKPTYHKIDSIVIGAGGAGLQTARKLAEKNVHVAVIAKVPIIDAHTRLAQGGISGSRRPEDSPTLHAFDTVKGSDFLADQDAVRVLTQEAPEVLDELRSIGVDFDILSDGSLRLLPFGGHSASRAHSVKDQTGRALHNAVFRKLLEMKGLTSDQITDVIAGKLKIKDIPEKKDAKKIDIFEGYEVIDLIRQGDEVIGAVAIDLSDNTIHVFQSKATVLATGGMGRLYSFSSNTPDNTGDGYALAARIGIPMQDMEFVQIHPSGIPPRGSLISEKARAEGGYLLNSRILEKWESSEVQALAKAVMSKELTTRSLQSEVASGAIPIEYAYLKDAIAKLDKDLSGEALVTWIKRACFSDPEQIAKSRFMKEYAPGKDGEDSKLEKAPRDVVSRSIRTEVKAGRGVKPGKVYDELGNLVPDDKSNYVYLDVRHLPDVRKKLEEGYDLIQQFLHLDPQVDLIPIQPTAHYSMGGIPTDLYTRVYDDTEQRRPGYKPKTMGGLYAVGEAASSSVHGSNRLGTNSLMELFVFGRRAAQAVAKDIVGKEYNQLPAEADLTANLKQRMGNFLGKGTTGRTIEELREELRVVMQDDAGVFRTETNLNHALKRINEYKEEMKGLRIETPKDFAEALIVENMLENAEMVVVGALARQESRGSHYREDHKGRNDKDFSGHTLAIRNADGTLTLKYKPVVMEYRRGKGFRMQARAYGAKKDLNLNRNPLNLVPINIEKDVREMTGLPDGIGIALMADLLQDPELKDNIIYYASNRLMDYMQKNPADEYVFDLSDPVHPLLRPIARRVVQWVLREFNFGKSLVTIRVNDNGADLDEDFNQVVGFVPGNIDKIFIRAKSADDVKAIDAKIRELAKDPKDSTKLLAGKLKKIEVLLHDPDSYKNVAEIIAASPLVNAVVMSHSVAGDLEVHRALGESLWKNDALRYQRAKAVLAVEEANKSRADGDKVQLIDHVITMNLNDENGIREAALKARAAGANGMRALTPKQAGIINSVFAESEPKSREQIVSEAQAIVAEYESAGRLIPQEVTFTGDLTDDEINVRLTILEEFQSRQLKGEGGMLYKSNGVDEWVDPYSARHFMRALTKADEHGKLTADEKARFAKIEALYGSNWRDERLLQVPMEKVYEKAQADLETLVKNMETEFSANRGNLSQKTRNDFSRLLLALSTVSENVMPRAKTLALSKTVDAMFGFTSLTEEQESLFNAVIADTVAPGTVVPSLVNLNRIRAKLEKGKEFIDYFKNDPRSEQDTDQVATLVAEVDRQIKLVDETIAVVKEDYAMLAESSDKSRPATDADLNAVAGHPISKVIAKLKTTLNAEIVVTESGEISANDHVGRNGRSASINPKEGNWTLISGSNTVKFVRWDSTKKSLEVVLQEGEGQYIFSDRSKRLTLQLKADPIQDVHEFKGELKIVITPEARQLLQEINIYLDDGFFLETGTLLTLMEISAPVRVAKENEDYAMTGDKKDEVGGIKLDSKLLKLEIKRDGKGMPLPADQQPVELWNVDGLVPTIIRMRAVSLPLLLGYNAKSCPKPNQSGGCDEQPADRKELSYLN